MNPITDWVFSKLFIISRGQLEMFYSYTLPNTLINYIVIMYTHYAQSLSNIFNQDNLVATLGCGEIS